MTWHDMTWHDMTWHDMTWHDISTTWHKITLVGGPWGLEDAVSSQTKNLDFRGLDSVRFLVFRGWNSQAHREPLRDLDSEMLSLRIRSSQVDHTRSPRRPGGRCFPADSRPRWRLARRCRSGWRSAGRLGSSSNNNNKKKKKKNSSNSSNSSNSISNSNTNTNTNTNSNHNNNNNNNNNSNNNNNNNGWCSARRLGGSGNDLGNDHESWRSRQGDPEIFDKNSWNFGWHYLSNAICLIRPHLFSTALLV